MEELSDAESADMSIENSSPSSPKMPTFRDEATKGHGSTVTHELLGVDNDMSCLEHCSPLHGSFGIGNYVSQIRSFSPVSRHQHDIIAPSTSPGSAL